MSRDDDDNESEYGLVMPFLPVKSKGGPHDDAAYVAGYEMGRLDAELAGSVFSQGHPIHVENREQADLIAMQHGFTSEFTGEDIPGWVCMSVRRSVEPVTP